MMDLYKARTTDFQKERRRTDDEFLKAAALAGAFEQWRLKHDHPINPPYPLRTLLPLSIEEITPRMDRARQRAGDRSHAFESVRECLDHQLGQCNHPHHEHFCAACPPRKGVDYRKFGVTDTDIDFSAEALVTGVTVRSVFTGVSEDQAAAIAYLADPPNWDDAAPTFFKETARVELNDSTRRYSVAPDPVGPRNGHSKGNGNGRASRRSPKYLLHERVEWAWSPLLTGGIINLLEITPAANDGRDDAKSFVEGVLKDLRQKKHPVPDSKLLASHETLIDYEYDLKECIQSKFVGGWEPRGLDTDDGSYKAVWSKQKNGSGVLTIQATKRISYSSKAAELFPGMSALLNLIAPAVTSMLMNHLTFYGPCSFLEFARERDGKGRSRPGSANRRTS
jgi:hypothetical protein